MPRYCYHCESCDKEFIVFHGINEQFDKCTLCDAKKSVTRLLSTPTVIKNNTDNKNDKSVGTLTKEYIELNKEILLQEKAKAKEEEYEPS